MILQINTKNKEVIAVSLKKGGKVIRSLVEQNKYGSQVLLSMISKLLDREKMNLDDLEAVEVEKGPGSFTGLRVGATVANALGFSLGIPVNGKKIETDIIY